MELNPHFLSIRLNPDHPELINFEIAIQISCYNQMKKGGEQNPLILNLLEANQIPQLIRMMFNRKTSQEYLFRYGEKTQTAMRKENEGLMEGYVDRFQIKDVVHLKGSQRGNVKNYCNTFISQYLSRKLKKGYRMTNQERRIAYVQLTEFYQLENLYEGLNQIDLPPEILNIIQKDVKRTYVSPEMHISSSISKKQQAETEMRQRLTEVLSSIAKYNPYISYCQGMNTIILFFIQEGFTNQQIFFVFKKITEELLPCDFYSTMDSTMTFVKILFQILHITHAKVVKKMKQIIKHMEGDDRFIVTMSFVFQWFICIFTNVNLNRNIRLRIMDYFMIEGVTVLFKTSLAFFDVMEETILKVNGIEEYMPEVERTMRAFNNEEILNKRLNSYMNKSILTLLVQKLILKSKITRKRQTKDNCNRKWNICLQSIEDNLAEGIKSQFFVFKTNEEIKIIDNYFDKFKNQYFRIGKSKSKSDLLRLGRMNHHCRYHSATSNTNDEECKSQNNSFIEYNDIQNSGNRDKGSPFGKKVSNFQKKYEGDIKEKKEFIRAKALKNLQKTLQNQRKSVISRSQSMQFMRSMIQNESFSNLIQILQVDQMDNIFKDLIQQND